jgi:hypothetical protein
LACDLQIDADLDTIPDPAYHFDADPDADPDFYLMRIHADPDRGPPHWLQRSFGGFFLLTCGLHLLAFLFSS